MRISGVAQKIIHHDQAGFMTRCRIKDQTKRAQIVIEWCNRTKTNGMIVCLDQEKVYNKILHTFLWALLESFGFSKRFVEIIKALYAEAHTKIILNREVSTSFKMQRGIRQGDPLSCLLFNVAIESLVQMLRNSLLKGLNINNMVNHLIMTLFVDDITVYLAEDNKFKDLKALLTDWCKASKTRFNIPKTVIVSIDTPKHRNILIATRKTHPNN